MIKTLINNMVKKIGYEIVAYDKEGIPGDMADEPFRAIYNACKAYSICSVAAMFALYKSIEYIVRNNIEGDLVECGVYKGGSAMLMAHTLRHFHETGRNIYLYDTFEGMPPPTEEDKSITGDYAGDLLDRKDKTADQMRCISPIEEVTKNMESTAYPKRNIFCTKGKVEDTIPGTVPDKIALLRLDTDWYESTKHELEHLYPILSHNGILIIDDYGYWQGARHAVDEYFEDHSISTFLERVDSTVRVCVKNV
ncbi:MAG: TylF/MycF/NovP-related O-methyltransferase [Thermodesulfobacteriota bacterium]